MATTVETLTQALPTLTLRSDKPSEEKLEEPYHYAHLNPHFSPATYPPLTDFEHVDPGHRALKHPNPQSFLDNATSVTALTPFFGTDISGVSLAALDSDGRDQLALLVCGYFLIDSCGQRCLLVNYAR